MAWNEPGGGNNSNNQDPWGGGNRGGGDNRGGKQGPPDLDEALRKLQDSLNGIFGNKKRGGGAGGNGRRVGGGQGIPRGAWVIGGDRKSTRLNFSHVRISYAVFCLKKKNRHITPPP